MIEGAAYGLDDAFFEARGGFNALAGCNTWTAAMLRQGGLTTGWWTPLPQLLDWSVRESIRPNRRISETDHSTDLWHRVAWAIPIP